MAKKLSNKYFVRKTENAPWEDVTEKFDGVHVLTVDGFDDQGESVNIYNEQWVTAQREDFLVAGDAVVRKNVDLKLTFICGTRYGASDTQYVHDTFIDYMCNQGDIYIKSKYTGKEAHVVCLKGYKPTTQKLQRGANDSYVMGTIELHTLDMPQTSSPEPILGYLYIGFGGATISNPLTQLVNRQSYNTDNPVGDYEIVCPSTSYLWICFSGTIGMVKANGFEVPTTLIITSGNLRCYRTYNAILPHTMNFSITQEI